MEEYQNPMNVSRPRFVDAILSVPSCKCFINEDIVVKPVTQHDLRRTTSKFIWLVSLCSLKEHTNATRSLHFLNIAMFWPFLMRNKNGAEENWNMRKADLQQYPKLFYFSWGLLYQSITHFYFFFASALSFLWYQTCREYPWRSFQDCWNGLTQASWVKLRSSKWLALRQHQGNIRSTNVCWHRSIITNRGLLPWIFHKFDQLAGNEPI